MTSSIQVLTAILPSSCWGAKSNFPCHEVFPFGCFDDCRSHHPGAPTLLLSMEVRPDSCSLAFHVPPLDNPF
ncbi:hypothetical protein BC567DRAFT_229416 [Phyllosticta citribraziliensis]